MKWLFFLVFLSSHSFLFSQWYDALALEYFESAHKAYLENNYSDSRSLLRAGLQYSSEFSDGWTLLGIFQSRDNNPSDAVDSFSRSLELANHRLFSEEQVRTHYLTLLHRLTRYSQIVQTQFDLFPLGQVLIHPEQTYILLDSLVRLGLREEYSELFYLATRSFPEDPRFWILLDPADFPVSLTSQQILTMSQSRQRTYIQALRRFIQQIHPGSFRAHWIREYLALTDDQDDDILSLYIMDEVNNQELIWSVLDNTQDLRTLTNLVAIQDILQFLQLTYPERTEDILHHFSSFTGTLIIDRNNDGFAQDFLTFENGMLVTWEADLNQDNKPEYRIDFSFSGPHSLTIFRGDEQWNFLYGRYPYVTELAVQNHAHRGVTTYIFHPFQVSLPLEQVPPNQGIIPILQESFSTDLFPIQSEQLFQHEVYLADAYVVLHEDFRSTFLEQRFGTSVSYTRVSPGTSTVSHTYQVRFVHDNITLDYFDTDGNGWYEYMLIGGTNLLLFRDQDPGAELVFPEEPEENKKTVSPQVLDLLLRYQVILHHRRNARVTIP